MYAIIPIDYVLEVIDNCYEELIPICPKFVLFAIDSSPQSSGSRPTSQHHVE